MRTLSFILAVAFVLAGPSLAGWSDATVPGAGTFAAQNLTTTLTATPGPTQLLTALAVTAIITALAALTPETSQP